MNLEMTFNLAELRIYVAFLGEKDHQNWWPSSFLSYSGEAFLTPAFPKTSALARVNGASKAAQIAHDEHIGVGEVFHLFRLPENIEANISQSLINKNSPAKCTLSEDYAYEKLQELADGKATQGIGPLLLEQNEIDQNLISQMAAAYLAGFKCSQVVYPYFRSNL